MEIKIIKEQYENLIKLVYLGNWMINAIRGGKGDEEQIEKYNDIEQYVFSFAKELGFDNFIEYDNKFKRYFPTNDFEEGADIAKYRADYDEDTFWQELPDRLGERDFWRKYGEEKIKEMNKEERFLKLQEEIIRYEEELERHGIERLEIKK